MAQALRRSGVKQVPLSEIQSDFSRFLHEAEGEEIVITRDGKPAGVLIGFASEDTGSIISSKTIRAFCAASRVRARACERGAAPGSRTSSSAQRVGWVERSETHRISLLRVKDGELSAEFPSGRQFFLHGQSGRSSTRAVDRPYCLIAGGVSPGALHPFTIEAAVILPDHLHAISTLPEQDADFARRWRLIKSAFSHGLMRGERISISRVSKGERGIWQRRYWQHTLRDQDDFTRHLDYIHFNPVKRGYAPRVQAWPYSSFRRWVRLGGYAEDRAGDPRTEARPFGER
jgi:putative transposase